MSTNVRIVAVASLLLVMASPAAVLGLSDPGPALELYRQERERAATVTVQDVGRFIFRADWGPEDGKEARVVVQAAGNSGKKEFRPHLKRGARSGPRRATST
jgi:hypothetical protein